MLTTILNQFLTVINFGYGNVTPIALYILSFLLIITFIFTGCMYYLGENINLPPFLIRKLLSTIIAYVLVVNYGSVTAALRDTFINTGLIAGSSSTATGNLMADPSAIFGLGVDYCNAILFNYLDATWTAILHPVEVVLKSLLAFFILIAFWAISLNVILAQIMFGLFTVATVILLPFLIFQPLAYLATKSIDGAFQYSIRLLFLALILSISWTILTQLNIHADSTFEELLTAAGVAWLIAILCFKSQDLASKVSGHPEIQGPSAGSLKAGAVTITRNLVRR